MSGNGFAVYTETFIRTSPEVLRLVQRVQGLHSTLDSTVSSLGECWGNDLGGYQFAQQYEETKAQMPEGSTACRRYWTAWPTASRR
jgi:hypothetical protein